MRTSEVEPRPPFSVSSPSSARLASLIEISRLLTSAVDLDHLLSLILKTSSPLVGSEDSSLLLLDPATQELVFVMAQGSVSDKLKMVRLKPGEGIAGWVVQHGKPLLVHDVERDPRFTSKIDKMTGFRTKAILAVPLQDHGRTVGVIEVLNPDKDRKFNEEDRELLTAYAAHAAVAIRNRSSRPNSCGCSKPTNSSAWGERSPSPWTSASSPPRTRPWKLPFTRGAFAKISSSDSTWLPSPCCPCASAKRIFRPWSTFSWSGTVGT